MLRYPAGSVRLEWLSWCSARTRLFKVRQLYLARPYKTRPEPKKNKNLLRDSSLGCFAIRNPSLFSSRTRRPSLSKKRLLLPLLPSLESEDSNDGRGHRCSASPICSASSTARPLYIIPCSPKPEDRRRNPQNLSLPLLPPLEQRHLRYIFTSFRSFGVLLHLIMEVPSFIQQAIEVRKPGGDLEQRSLIAD
ncbi:uncharacterized protein LOC110029288 [Phalaenopsis equestris]|uniref:uncharacterized protein LOC110029288 n=1 Tax=Phalaenopsis equestris TaxID=78828 RepID=UPI0009E1FFA7|nr:uncharacterized protein LOC110029288 [Phalaenopsis equestris]